MSFPAAALASAKRVRLLVLDVDGVLTDGRLYYLEGDREAKAFFTQDGAGLKMLMTTGISVAIVTGRRSDVVRRRASELGIRRLFEGVDDKGACIDELAVTTGISGVEMAHVGDDLPDLPAFNRVGFKIGVPGAHPVVLDRADYVTSAPAGLGAVREVCELLMVAQDTWTAALGRFDR